MEITSDINSVYEQHREPMMRLAVRLLGDIDEANDVVSDVVAHIVERPATIRENAASYLLSSVRNRCLNLLRHKRLSERVHKLLPIGEDTAAEPETFETEDVLDAMLQFVDTELTPQTRQVVRLRFQEQMSYRQISMRLGISEVAVYKHLAQAISRLKARFNP